MAEEADLTETTAAAVAGADSPMPGDTDSRGGTPPPEPSDPEDVSFTI